MRTLLVIDMQVASFDVDPPQHDAEGTVDRINRLAAAVRKSGGSVVFVQHDGGPESDFVPDSRGWELIPSLEREKQDPIVNKTACDSFYETRLQGLLSELGTRELWICGSATDYCVDTTVRAAASLNYDLTVVSDGHTTSDRPYMDAATIKEHHNSVWENLVLPRATIRLATTDELIAGLRQAAAGTD